MTELKYFFVIDFICHFKGAGDASSLEISLWPEPDEYVSYLWNFYGIVIDIHVYDKYPDFKNMIQIQPGYDLRIYVSPSIVVTDDVVS